LLPIRVITGLPGSGKTRHVINQITSVPGKYLFATSRRDLIRERMADIRHAKTEFGTSPDLFPIYSPDQKSDTQDRPIDFSVASEIRSLPHRHAEAAHVVAMVTHEGLMAADLSAFEGWHLVIDENPSAVASGSFCAAAGALYLERAYELTPEPGTAFHRVSLRPRAPSPRSLLRDDLLKDLIPFDKRARSTHGVLVDLADWGEAENSDRVVNWYSVWSLADLTAFASISIAAAGYMESLAFKATEKTASLSYETVPVPESPRARPRVEIDYFATHRGSTDYWTNPEKPEGNAAFAKAVEYLKTVDLGFWATNDKTEAFMRGAGLSGTMLRPKTEGTNSYRHHTSCAFIYSNKAQRSDAPLLKAFGLRKADIERARQGEDVIQFVFRGAIRNPDFAGTYRIYLYDKEQAEALADYMNEHAIGDVHLIPIEEAGIMDVSRPKTGPTPMPREERLRRDRERKQRERADKKALLANMTALKAKSEGKAS